MRKRLIAGGVLGLLGLLLGDVVSRNMGLDLTLARVFCAIAGVVVGCVLSVVLDVMTQGTSQ